MRLSSSAPYRPQQRQQLPPCLLPSCLSLEWGAAASGKTEIIKGAKGLWMRGLASTKKYLHSSQSSS